MKNKTPKLDTSKIVQVQLKETQYYQEEYPKKQIVLHHTVSNGNAKSVMNWWASTPAKIGVAFIIDREGIIYQCFSSKHWAHHLGTKAKINKQLNQESIGIELCSWGGLIRKENSMLKGSPKFFSSTGTEVPASEVVKPKNPFRGYLYFQKYTDKQLKSMQILVNYLCEAYNIPKTYNADMWDYSRMAIKGIPGIYSHVSFRKDKSDCFPQKELIEILKQI
ncbi:MAG: peptidoglycan recognition family protein [Bacteroidota bacterium]